MLTGAHEPFEFLLERVPIWLKTLHLLSPAGESHKPDHTTSDNDQPPPTLTDGTSHSGVSEDHTLIRNETYPSPRLNPNPVFLKKRKRETESGGSRRKNYSEQNATVLQYNGDAQKDLVALVNDISKATGLIRQFKIAGCRSPPKSPATPPLLYDFHVSGNQADGNDKDDANHDILLEQVRKRRRQTPEATGRFAKHTMRRAELTVAPRAATEQNDTTLLDTTAKALENVSDLCEMAAYQLLRDGNCRAEARAATSRLEAMYALVVKEAATLQELRRHAVTTTVEALESAEQTRSSSPAYEALVMALPHRH